MCGTNFEFHLGRISEGSATEPRREAAPGALAAAGSWAAFVIQGITLETVPGAPNQPASHCQCQNWCGNWAAINLRLCALEHTSSLHGSITYRGLDVSAGAASRHTVAPASLDEAHNARASSEITLCISDGCRRPHSDRGVDPSSRLIGSRIRVAGGKRRHLGESCGAKVAAASETSGGATSRELGLVQASEGAARCP